MTYSPAKPPKSLLRSVGRAIADYQMIKAHDRLLLGLSGGKDSLALLQILIHLQQHAPIHFDIAAITVDPLIPGFDPSVLKPYLADLNIPYFYRTQPIMDEAQQHLKGDSFCAYCARMKRGIMYTTARQNGYNTLVLAQHLDDLAESFLMSAFHGGRLNTMKACYQIDTGDLHVIRPLVYVRERQTAEFAKAAQLPVVPDNCPACFTKPTGRAQMKTLLAQQERLYPHLFRNLLHTLRPLMDEKSIIPAKPFGKAVRQQEEAHE
ncbi:ATP-binding protein [Thioflexithrix psekupsensis]|uniref:tRNA 2-thiocytidine(32) synthetase TtcA n=1 Tax=Thioflexithrix psekupsensis TaxID=1570016 RepID=A0A251X597_9GAMM|nr:ATP-binding protein [Thioflexithrix psekupsensis]OUD12379.1 tRNA 2-thiocytidine(32) synthetase TtcA [Thioflexithrix psekupsensis]